MAHLDETRIGGTVLYDGRIIRVERDEVRLEDGTETIREVVRHPGGAAILPVDAEGNATLVRQFRYAFGREILEIPAGKLEPGEDPKTAAVRELEEECGLVAGEITDLGCIYPSVGYDDEVIYLFLARELSTTVARPDDGEFVTLEQYPLEELTGMAERGEIRDAKTVTAILKTSRML